MALLLFVNPNLSVAQMDSILEVTSVDLGDPGKDNYYGAGRVDIYQAALAALELTGTEENTAAAVEGFGVVLSAVSPNPVLSQASFSLYMPIAGIADVTVYDVAGRTVSSVHTGQLDSGSHMFSWNVPGELGSGLYMVRASTPSGTSVSRMTLIR